ncbi:RNA-directed DNA polymerase, eukaryota [Tanacetum coccineum]
MGDRRSKEDDVNNISTSIFVTNFPDSTTTRDLWRMCNQYGNVIDAFIPNRRSKAVTWIDLEGVPLCVWSHNTFVRISSKWGSLLHEEEDEETHFHRKRICIKTTLDENIFETFKIIVKGKIFWIRAKEVTGWTPDFNDCDEDLSDTDDDAQSVKSEDNTKNVISDVDSEIEEIPETIFEQADHGDIKSTAEKGKISEDIEDGQSADPFNLYDLLKKNKHGAEEHNKNSHDMAKVSLVTKHVPNSNTKEDDAGVSNSSGHFRSVGAPNSGGSILLLMEDLINVGQTMGYKMDGCINNFEEIVKNQGKTKMEQVNLFNIKSCWGNLSFDFAVSPSVGNSGGILCVWDPKMFLKENSTVSDYFIAIMGKWKGDVIIMGDFNEVRCQEERFGSIFNSQGAAAFNNFISLGGLVEVSSGGYSFTWSHKSASKIRDENTKNSHGIINKQRNNLAIRGILVDGAWIEDPIAVKNEFLNHFRDRFNSLCSERFVLIWIFLISLNYRSIKGSILVNGSPTSEFQFQKGLKQGDPLSPFLFILVMKSLHLSFQKVVNAGSGYQQKDRKPSQNDKTEHGMEKTVQNQGQSPKMPKSEESAVKP